MKKTILLMGLAMLTSCEYINQDDLRFVNENISVLIENNFENDGDDNKHWYYKFSDDIIDGKLVAKYENCYTFKGKIYQYGISYTDRGMKHFDELVKTNVRKYGEGTKTYNKEKKYTTVTHTFYFKRNEILYKTVIDYTGYKNSNEDETSYTITNENIYNEYLDFTY